MKKIIVLLLIFAYLVVFVSSIQAQEALPDLIAQIKPSVVSIVTYDKNGRKIAGGSGFCVATDRIITNKHVIEDAFRVEVQTTNGKSYRVTDSSLVDKDGDLALLKTESLPSQIKPLTIAKFSPREGEKIFVVGNPLGLEGSVSDGIVAAFRNVRSIGKLIQITAPISPGSSGSPVINIWGDVIGVATLNLEGGQNLNFAISSERIVSLWSNQLTISDNNYPNPSTTLITEEQRLKAEQLFAKGIPLHLNKEFDKALSYYLEAIQINPNYAAAQLGAGNCKFELKQYREAVENFKQVIRIYPKESNMIFQAYNGMSFIFYFLKQYEESVEASKQAIRLNSNSYLTFHYLGLSYYALKQYKDAVDAFQKAISLNVSDSEANKTSSIYSLGLAYLAFADKKSALEQQKLLVNLDAEKAKALLSLLSNMSGDWRSVSDKGFSDTQVVYKIVDNGVKITLQTIYKGEPGIFCEGKWEGDFAFGTALNGELICAFERIDSTQLKYTNFPRKNFNDPIEKVFTEAREKIEKIRYSLRKIE